MIFGKRKNNATKNDYVHQAFVVRIRSCALQTEHDVAYEIATRTPILSIMLRNANMVTLIRASAVGSVMRARVALVMRMVV